ncbi:prephenate dehydratase [Calidifontibacillus erzurumensis]|uniref:Prephenate dehydratase n=1 Tax=Calidifontibacillus erzurumensis TaxID=2741433 RepID=A0A8J8KAJ2_9BACI|nr:prephenate dehydratase [Calidifontibacillus erzurumensis]NSL50153.1 prephenate dehydratase [Calidifontibacillus erzurumensis]
MSLKVGYLGPKGTFTKIAVNEIFPESEKIPYDTIPASIDAVMNGEVEYTVVPLENAIEGSVNITIDYLIHEQNLPIVGEIVVPIRQHLMVHPSNKDNWEKITVVLSHSHAIAQCHKYLHTKLPHVEIQYVKSTGAAAEYVHEHPEECVAAIGNELAAKEYGLEIVQRDVHDYDNNHTRFVILHKEPVELSTDHRYYGGDRTTLMVTLPSDYAGALHQVLSAFAWRKLNLSKIESRPMKTGLGNYFFLIDVEMKMDDVLIPGAVAEIEALGCSVRILGSYPYYQVGKEFSKIEK